MILRLFLYAGSGRGRDFFCTLCMHKVRQITFRAGQMDLYFIGKGRKYYDETG